jgi:hypothetical protein
LIIDFFYHFHLLPRAVRNRQALFSISSFTFRLKLYFPSQALSSVQALFFRIFVFTTAVGNRQPLFSAFSSLPRQLAIDRLYFPHFRLYHGSWQ